ncbi:hypothetical protein DU319_22600 [Escherichia coli]|nr:hypothetical protein [Escherichia coli]EFE8272940.1 hypothetical protein [Escherichia coli]EFN6002194.1 hypothetical protein [Escherichia coli]RRL54094.1 hypothetical protein DU319_22600 [Escherichia coli]HAH3100609.1 hypothetical protein [Escherichia coli]
MSIKNDGHYFCGVGRNRPDGSDETLTVRLRSFVCIADDAPEKRVNMSSPEYYPRFPRRGSVPVSTLLSASPCQ